MTKKMYVDCSSGVAGDMLLAALLDAGADVAMLREQLQQLPLESWQISVEPVQRQGISAQAVRVNFTPAQQHRVYADIKQMIEQAAWPDQAKEIAGAAFAVLAKAEATVHGVELEQVHFHEVGAVDSIIDICGAALALAQLNIGQVYCSSLPLDKGFVDCEHGRLALPAPATAQLLQGWQLFPSQVEGETVTPTGAAILRGVKASQSLPTLTIERIGYGAGQRDFAGQANIVRVMIGSDEAADLPRDMVAVLTTNIDDSSGELLGQLWDKLAAAGVLDISYSPLLMKKGRPAWRLEIICQPDAVDQVAQLVFSHTTTTGLRVQQISRLISPKESVIVSTNYGQIAVNISGDTIAPEADAVAAAAAKHNTSFKLVYQAAIAAYLNNK